MDAGAASLPSGQSVVVQLMSNDIVQMKTDKVAQKRDGENQLWRLKHFLPASRYWSIQRYSVLLKDVKSRFGAITGVSERTWREKYSYGKLSCRNQYWVADPLIMAKQFDVNAVVQ